MKSGTLIGRWCWPAAMFWMASTVLSDSAVGQKQKEAEDLAGLDLSTLMQMDVEVTSVSKKATPLSESAAAIAVVTRDDIRRLGITSLPEALRLVPGMEVAHISADRWAVSARGFNLEFAGKLLVLIDGRSVYSPSTAAVFWEAQDVMLEDIERIEVIRGPGATLWGANAVNGVINIITRNARATEGALVSAAAGLYEDQPSVSARYGRREGEHLAYRGYVKYLNRPGFVDSAGEDTADDLHSLRGGFRADWTPASGDLLTLQGDLYRAKAGKTVTAVSLNPLEVSLLNLTQEDKGGNLLARWTRAFDAASSLTLQIYYDRAQQGDGYGVDDFDTYDLDLQHRFAWGRRQDVVWGAGYRYAKLRHDPASAIVWDAPAHTLELYNLFVQDEIALVPGRLSLTLGSKFEHNNLVDWEIQPNVRLLWRPDDRQALWAAASRASRTPSIFERTGRLVINAFPSAPGGLPILVSFEANSQLDAERLRAYELGYRIAPVAHLSFDLATFYNQYEDLSIVEADTPVFELSPLPHLRLPLHFRNAQSGHTYGAELAAQWEATDRLKLMASCSWIEQRLHPDSVATSVSPQVTCKTRAYLNLSSHLEANAALAYVDAIQAPINGELVAIPAYTRLDLGLVWHASATVQVGLWGQNLLDNRHLEFASQQSALLTEVPRNVLGKITWAF